MAISVTKRFVTNRMTIESSAIKHPSSNFCAREIDLWRVTQNDDGLGWSWGSVNVDNGTF